MVIFGRELALYLNFKLNSNPSEQLSYFIFKYFITIYKTSLVLDIYKYQLLLEYS